MSDGSFLTVFCDEDGPFGGATARTLGGIPYAPHYGTAAAKVALCVLENRTAVPVRKGSDSHDRQDFSYDCIPVVSRLTGFNGGTYDRIRCLGEDVDSQEPAVRGSVATTARLTGFNGSTFDRVRTTSASALAAANGVGALQVGNVGNWSISHAPNSGVLATVTRVGEPGRRHVVTSIAFSVSGSTTSPHRDVELVDGTNVVWRLGIGSVLNDSKQFAVSGLSIVAGVGNPVTLRFSAAPPAANFQRVSLNGYTAR